MKQLDYLEGKLSSYLVEEGEILVVRGENVSREEALTTAEHLAEGTWLAVDLNDLGSVVVERFRKFSEPSSVTGGAVNG